MPFRKKVRIYFDQGDPAQVAFYGQHSIIVQRVMEDCIPLLGIPWKDWYGNKNLFMPIVKLHNEYKKPLLPGKDYIVEILITHVGKSSLGCSYKIFSLKKELCCTVSAVYVCTDRLLWKSRPFPKKWLPLLKKVKESA